MQDTADALHTHLPPDDPLRQELHNEVHARPPARIQLPALVVFVAVLNEGVGRAAEWEHLRQLPGQQDLSIDDLAGNFVRLQLGSSTLKWERHTEFTRYSIVLPLPGNTTLADTAALHLDPAEVPADWLRRIPGRTVAAIRLAMVQADLPDGTPAAQARLMEPAARWFDGRTVVASQLGGGHS